MYEVKVTKAGDTFRFEKPTAFEAALCFMAEAGHPKDFEFAKVAHLIEQGQEVRYEAGATVVAKELVDEKEAVA